MRTCHETGSRIRLSAGVRQNGEFRGKMDLGEDGTVEAGFSNPYSKDTEEWKPWFTGIYTKIDEANRHHYQPNRGARAGIT